MSESKSEKVFRYEKPTQSIVAVMPGKPKENIARMACGDSNENNASMIVKALNDPIDASSVILSLEGDVTELKNINDAFKLGLIERDSDLIRWKSGCQKLETRLSDANSWIELKNDKIATLEDSLVAEHKKVVELKKECLWANQLLGGIQCENNEYYEKIKESSDKERFLINRKKRLTLCFIATVAVSASIHVLVIGDKLKWWNLL